MMTRKFIRGNALTDFFFRDTGINQNEFNIGQQLLSVGIVVLEVRDHSGTVENDLLSED